MAIAVLLLLAAGFGQQFGSMDVLVRHEWELRQRIASHPVQAFAAGLTVFTLLSLVPGAVGKTIAVGWLFGFPTALAISSIGLTLAAMMAFSASRFLLRDRVESRLGPIVQWINQKLEQEGAVFLLLARLLHLPYTAINYSAGASRVRPATLAWTTFVGMLPGNVISAWLGATLPTLDTLAREGPSGFLRPWLIAAWTLMVVVGFFIRWAVRSARKI